MEAIVARLEAVTIRLESVSSEKAPASPATDSSSTTSSASLAELDDIVSTSLAAYSSASTVAGGLLQEQAIAVSAAFVALRGIIATASTSKKPEQKTLQGIIAPLQQVILKITGIKDANRSSKQFNQLSVVAEGIPALGWVVVEPTPAPYIAEMKDSAQFYVNRVIKEFKGTYVWNPWIS